MAPQHRLASSCGNVLAQRLRARLYLGPVSALFVETETETETEALKVREQTHPRLPGSCKHASQLPCQHRALWALNYRCRQPSACN